MQIDSPIDRKTAMNLLENAGLSHSDAGFVVGAFKRLVETPLGEKLHFGTVNVKGATVQTLTRTKCTLQDDRVLLYALYRYAEACQDYYEFSLSRLMNTSIDSAGISPVKLFGFAEDEMITMLNGLSAKYPAFINVTFTHGLDKISLREDKTSDDVLRLFS
jgi:phosphoadenosine phosphosulfate reductase